MLIVRERRYINVLQLKKIMTENCDISVFTLLISKPMLLFIVMVSHDKLFSCLTHSLWSLKM